MQRTVLMFALQFPPYGQSTGRLRTLSFVRHLPEHGWKPVVISARESAYPEIDPRTVSEIPSGTTVARAWGFDAARALSIRGTFPRWLATPDRWNSWAAGAFVTGLQAVKTWRPKALWATFPIPSALLAVLALHRITGIPLVADFRDPLVYDSWPVSPWDRRVYGWLERNVVRDASAVSVTTPSACALYRARYPDLPAERFQLIANGIDNDRVPGEDGVPAGMVDGAISLVHSGLMESPDRDPTAFFQALRILSDGNLLPRKPLNVVLRASGNETKYAEAARAIGVGSIVRLLPRIPHQEALREIAGASGLLLFQGRQCNQQIPAKAYEYLASGRPIIGLMHPAGDTHALVKGQWGVPYAADMNDPECIARMLMDFFADLEAGRPYVPPARLQAQYVRSARAAELAQLLDSVAGK